MLQDKDLVAFLEAWKGSDHQPLPSSLPDVLERADGLYAAEVWRLGCSLQIAATLGDAPQEAVDAAKLISREIGDLRCAPINEHHLWTTAIAWARARLNSAGTSPRDLHAGREREEVVGTACLRLRKQGYTVEVGAYGPRVAETSRRDIVAKAEILIRLLGGIDVTGQVLAFLKDTKSFHDGIWLFGERGLNIYDAKRPMLPVGWLFSLAIRHLNRPRTARKPEIAWKSLCELATDFAAAHDCQRYSQFEDLDPHASQLHRMLVNSTLWRELFTLPQIPPTALRHILTALGAGLTPEDRTRLGLSFDALTAEIRQLLERSADDRLTLFSRSQIEQELPVLRSLTGGAVETVNAGYGDPTAASMRTQDSTLLFACGLERAITMPRAFLAASACEHVFRFIWSKLESKRAAEIVGSTLERAIANACTGKAPTVVVNRAYKAGGRRYELDVATRDEDRIVLIETKGKSLTQRSRSGDMFAFFRDYSDSFLAMFAQLVRHEVHLKEGQSPLIAVGEVVDDLRPIKVAVSPLSYGPVSDKVLSSGVLRSIVGAKLVLVAPNPEHEKIVSSFNQRTSALIDDMLVVAPKRDGRAELFPYLIDVFWLDLGQLLYILDRSNTVWDAFRPLKHMTFSSRDFWTELAYADRQGLTDGKWRPLL